MEWALVSKKNPKKILKWFGPEKPSKKMIAKEERRIHAFSSINNQGNIDEVTVKKELIMMANHLDETGYKKEADFLDQLIKKADEGEGISWDHVNEVSEAKRKKVRHFNNLLNNTPSTNPVSWDHVYEISEARKQDQSVEDASEMEDVIFLMKLKFAEKYLEEEKGKDKIEDIRRNDPELYQVLLLEELAYYLDLKEELVVPSFENNFMYVENPSRYSEKIYDKYLEIKAQNARHKVEEDLRLGRPSSEDDLIDFVDRNPSVSDEIYANNIVKALIKLSNRLDLIGQHKEADILDEIIKSAKKKKKKPSKKQLKSLDKNHNGKIDKEDFKILRRKRKENKADDSGEKKKCANCGHMNHHDAEKCSKCGHTKFEK